MWAGSEYGRGPRAVDGLRRKTVSGQFTHMSMRTHTQSQTSVSERGGCSLAKVVLDHKVRHLHVAEIEQREEVHRHVWELSETD